MRLLMVEVRLGMLHVPSEPLKHLHLVGCLLEAAIEDSTTKTRLLEIPFLSFQVISGGIPM